MAENEVDLDSIIDRLLEVRGSRPGKQVQLLETEIRYLCTKAREIFISQPILLELEAPIKICGDIHGQYYDLSAALRVWRLPPRGQLPLPRRLRRPWQTVSRDDMPFACIQDQVPRELLRSPRQPRVRLHQPHLRLLR